ncbi:MAG: SRPBCC domain-containing protein [Candidatus Eisenbacteria bacterium]|nr:SRPBCC domain-containing protein [Candidatus Eisenbacteria bacterium]
MSANIVLEFEAELAAPPERVFAALTEGRHLERWFCDACESEPHEEGRLTMRWRRAYSSPWPYEATWIAIEPPHRAACRGGHQGYPNRDAGTITFTLAAAAGVTKLRVTHEMGHPALYANFAKGYSDAWPRALRRLGEYLSPKPLEKT